MTDPQYAARLSLPWARARSRSSPKKECCVSSTKCNRCPLRMLKEGTLPQGYTVHKRKLVKVKKAKVKKTGKKKAA